jgi:hypothetical protein
MPFDDTRLFIRDIIDFQLESADQRALGRVADIEMEWQEDGRLVLVSLLTGPQALAGRVARGLRRLLTFLLRDRFEAHIDLEEVSSFEASIKLRHNAEHYQVGQSERWIARHILRWIPGSGF